MAFYAYMLECADGSIHVGHTDDLAARLAAHRGRRYSGYTAKRLPVALIFSDAFGSRDEAFRAERQIKGWSRAKKIALARGEWELVRQLASIRSLDRRAAVAGGPDTPHVVAPLMVRVPHHERGEASELSPGIFGKQRSAPRR